MPKLYNIARMTTATTGTGTITLGSAVSGYLTFAQAGVSNGDVVSYGIEDGTSREVGTGTYTSSGTTLSRTVLNSTNSGSAISLSGSAQVFITPLTVDVFTSYGTSLPASPVDGQEAILVDSTTNPSYQWRFRYNASSTSSYKWEFVGGNPAVVSVDTDQSTSSTTYAALTTAGPSFTLPRAGDYQVTISCEAYNTATATTVRMSYDIGATGAVNGDAVIVAIPVAGNSVASYRTQNKTGLSAVALTAKYNTAGGTSNFRNRTLIVTPVRVS